MRFDPPSYRTGRNISLVSSLFLILSALGASLLAFLRRRCEVEKAGNQ